MTKKTLQSRPIWHRAFGGKYGLLLAALLLLLASAPTITVGHGWHLAVVVLTSAVFVACLYASRPRASSVLFGCALAMSDFGIGQIAGQLEPTNHLRHALLFVQVALGLVILVYSAGALLSRILDGGRVTDETLQGALCVYLLIGMIWAYIYAALQLNDHAAIILPEIAGVAHPDFNVLKLQFLRLLYFSYTTLTTLGMGDITPQSSVAQMCVCLEAVTGQIFMTVLIARLVGMHIAQTPASRSSDG